MRRFNLFLPKEQNIYLENVSDRRGITKAKFLRELFQSRKNSEYFKNKKFTLQKWNLVHKVAFNLKLPDDLDNWLEENSNMFGCNKSEIVRNIIELERNKKPEFTVSDYKRAENIDLDKRSILVDNINSHLINRNYFYLNKHLLNTSYNDIVNLGVPEFIVYVIGELEANYKEMSKNLLVLKAEMLWFLGRTSDAIAILENLKDKHLEINSIKAKLLYGEILADLGNSKKSKAVLDEIASSINLDTPNTLTVKLLNKLGLSKYYIDSLEEVQSCYEKALEYAKTDEEKAIAKRYLASLYVTFEDIETSEKIFEESEELFNKIPNKNLNEYCRLLITIGDLELTKANWKKSQDYTNKAIKIATKIHHTSNLSWALRIHAESLFNLGRFDVAQASINKSINIAESIGSISSLTKSYRVKAKYLISKKKFAEAGKALETSRHFEKKLSSGSMFNYNMTTKWQNYINFINGKDVDFGTLHSQSRSMNLKKQFKDETINDFVLGYLYLSSPDESKQKRGEQILKRVHNHTMEVGYKRAQFAIEGIYKFGAFSII